ncbi:RNA polymerase sigma factor SigV [compost metagenome]
MSSYEQLLIDREQDSERKQRMEAAINKLTARQKELIRLRFFEQLSYEEIAERTSISVRTIYNTIHTAINLMRQEVTLPIIICWILSDQKLF